MAVKLTFDIITPDTARTLVETHKFKTNVFSHRQRSQIRTYATDMAEGRWTVNGDAIIIDEDGRIIDGRKRLFACAEAVTAFPTLVVRGVSASVADYIDQHKRRSSKDAVHIAGFDNAGLLTPTAATVVDIAHTGLPSQQLMSSVNLLRFVQDHPGVGDVRTEVSAHPLKQFYSPSDLAALLYLTRMIDRQVSDLFFSGLLQAIENKEKRPVHGRTPLEMLAAGLEAIQTQVINGGQTGSSRTRYVQVVYTIKAWNAAWHKTTLGRLKYDQARKEDAPLLAGLAPEPFASYVNHKAISVSTTEVENAYRSAIETSRPTAEIVRITPQQAMEMLTVNGPLHDGEGRNRTASTNEIDAYSRDMKAGRWKVTGQAVKFSRSGRMIDGQHRLRACVKADTPFDTIVVRDLDDSVFGTFDVGHQHTLSHILTGRGESYATTMQGALRQMFHYEESGFNASTVTATLSELLDLFDRYPQIRENAKIARRAGFRNFMLAPAKMAALVTVLHIMDKPRADDFLDRLENGTGIMTTKDPVGKLRTKLTSLVGGSRRTGVSSWPRLYLVCLAWNAYSSGKGLVFPKAVADLSAPAPFDRPSPQVLAAAVTGQHTEAGLSEADARAGWRAVPAN